MNVAPALALLGPLIVSPAELHRLDTPQFGFELSYANAKDEQVYDGGKITDVVKDEGLRVVYGTPQGASSYWSISAERRTRQSERELEASPSVTTADHRRRLNVTASGAFKIMDRILVGASLGSNALTSDDGDNSGFLNGDLALAVKSEAYDAGFVQHIARIAARDDEVFWTHAQDLHLRVQTTDASAWRTLISRGPQTTCCVPATTHHMTYAIGHDRTLERLSWHGIYRYAPAYKEDARFGKIYDITRHGVELGATYAASPTWQIGVAVNYATGRDKNAAVDIPTALKTVATADFKAQSTGAALTSSIAF